MTLAELLRAWELGAIISYSYGQYKNIKIGKYRADRVDVVSDLFYRAGIKFKVQK